jgi:bifunctional non-homologous end joining protein LigD
MAKLSEYHKKRDFAKTREPEGEVHDSASRIFVVQKHAATRLHYDLRLELDGVLKSWAVPKGPSMNPGDKRLAIQVEDHPYDYRKFEGSIPKGEYGGGEVIVWDEGTYAPEGGYSAHEGLAKGDFKFQLFGEKLRGSFVLVRIKYSKTGAKNEWLLIKHRDSFVDPNWDAEQHAESVLTGRTLEDIAKGRAGSGKRRNVDPSTLTGATKTKMPAMPKGVPVSLSQLQEKPFSHPDWLFEIKWDGVRSLAQIEGGKTTLWARSGRDVTREYPEFKELATHFRVKTVIADGEIATLDEEGRSDFQKLQNRLGSQNPAQKIMQAIPVNYYFFDILYADGYDLRRVPLLERKQFLNDVLITDNRIHFSDHVAEQGEALFQAAREKGLEGIIAKKADSTYAGNRTASWVKIKIVQELDAVVAGYTAGRGSRKYFGALVLGLYDKRELKFIGNVGTGFDESKLEKIFDRLQELKIPRSPFKTIPALREEVEWVKPRLVARVKYGQWTDELHLRAPVFLSLRNDRTAEDCTFDAVQPAAKPPESEDTPHASEKSKGRTKNPSKTAKAAEPTFIETPELDSEREEGQGKEVQRLKSAKPIKSTKAAAGAKANKSAKSSSDSVATELRDGKSETLDIESDGQRLHLTNLNKIYFPELAVKKRELLAYYYRMADYILTYLKDRPIVMRRYPDGVDGKAFFQKEAPSYLPDWIETATVHSDERGGEMQYVLANSRATLLYLTNLGCIDHNPWSSRADSQDNPDYVFFDLDPTPGTPFSDVLHIAKEIHALLKSIRMHSFLKTSGASGFHIFIPLEPHYTYEQTRTFAEVVGRMVAAENPKLTTFERTVSKRPDGRILIDALQNARGKPLACVYSVRAFPKATVSTPVHPEELTKSFSAERWNLRNFDERLNDVGDLWRDFWHKRQTLDRSLELLAKKLPKEKTRKS